MSIRIRVYPQYNNQFGFDARPRRSRAMRQRRQLQRAIFQQRLQGAQMRAAMQFGMGGYAAGLSTRSSYGMPYPQAGMGAGMISWPGSGMSFGGMPFASSPFATGMPYQPSPFANSYYPGSSFGASSFFGL